jgi:N,N'-diacetylchitobiose transport system permease protein
MSAVEKPATATSRRRLTVPGTAVRSAPRPRGRRRSLTPPWVPYALVAPAMAVMVAVTGYPLVSVVLISLQHFRAFELINGTTKWIGLDNYRSLLSQPQLVQVLIRTIIFTAVNVGLTMAIGLGIAMLMRRTGRTPRLVLSISLILVWSIPQITATQVWEWLFDRDFGIVNWLLVNLHIGNFFQHSWLSEGASLLTVSTIIVVWGAVPFVALTLYAGLLQIPEDLYEAARVDGAGALSQLRGITMPLLAPILLLLALLSTIWDFRVFTQVYVLQQSGGITSQSDLMGIFAYHEAFGGNNYGRGAAISVISTVFLIGITALAVRRMVRAGETR